MTTLLQQWQETQATLAQAFKQGASIADLLQQRSVAVDQLLLHTWQAHRLPLEHFCLIATGGYGREELHPYSDIDILIIADTEHALRAHQMALESWIQHGWDLNLTIAQNITTIDQLATLARENIATATSLLDARLITGHAALFEQCRKETNPHYCWESEAFYKAKRLEQKQRHEKYGNTSYNLEPNIKSGPGGLRDIQTIFWIAKQHFLITKPKELVKKQFLTYDEYTTLVANKNYLNHLRSALHYLAGRKEERLLFDHQVNLAQQVYPQYHDPKACVEALMKKHFRITSEINEINDMLLQFFRENILTQQQHFPYTTHAHDFIIQNHCIGVAKHDLFDQRPAALLDIFLVLAQHPDIQRINADTLRLIRQKRYLIDDAFCQNKHHQHLFLQIIQHPSNIAKQLHTMNRYGLLGRYLPHFGEIVGQMQYDLFHTLTVDRHLIRTVNFLYSFTQETAMEKFPLCYKIMQHIPKRSTLYLAGLFHDIGKGRGDDHSLLGADFTDTFCKQHGLPAQESELIVWLIKHHLLMSFTAQKCDIQDPEVIADFSHKVETIEKLNALYVLTCADICATNEKLWNHWRDSLLKTLYQMTMLHLQQHIKHQKTGEQIAYNRNHAKALLVRSGIEKTAIDALWQGWGDDYFLHHTAKVIARHTAAILKTTTHPVVVHETYGNQSGTEVFIYCQQHMYNFPIITALFDRLRLNILYAQITLTENGYHLGSYVVVDAEGKMLRQKKILDNLLQHIHTALMQAPSLPNIIPRHTSKRIRHFKQKTHIEFRQDEKHHYTVIEISTVDFPGLLARISIAFAKAELIIEQAKIVTLGEKVEDVFFVTDKDFQPITDQKIQQAIRDNILTSLL